MSLHQTIKEQIIDALRAKDTIRLDTLRGLNALAQNEMIATAAKGEYLPDAKIMSLIKRSVKQRKDSIEQFTAGGRKDLVSKEKAELKILEAFTPAAMPRSEIKTVARAQIEAMKAKGTFDSKSAGKLVGIIMKELAGKADGTDVKAVVDDLLKK